MVTSQAVRVSLAWAAIAGIPWLMGADADPNTLWERLSRIQQAKVLMALLGLLLLALVMLLVISAGARMVRRFARQGVGPSRAEQDDWARKPLVGELEDEDDLDEEDIEDGGDDGPSANGSNHDQRKP